MGNSVHSNRNSDRKNSPGDTRSVRKNGDCRNIHTDCDFNLGYDISDDAKMISLSVVGAIGSGSYNNEICLRLFT